MHWREFPLHLCVQNMAVQAIYTSYIYKDYQNYTNSHSIYTRPLVCIGESSFYICVFKTWLYKWGSPIAL